MNLDPFAHPDSVRAFLHYARLQSRKPGLSFLGEIVQAFARLPYENLSKILKLNQHWERRDARLRLPEEVIEDHLERRLGGTCFSLTFFLQSILTQHGFACYPVMADMKAGRNIHCCLVVRLEGVKYLVDPGYLLTQPMELNPAKPRLFRSEFAGVELRRVPDTDAYDLFTFNRHETKWRYRFRDRPVPADEFLQHWQASFSWNSMHGLCLTKVLDGGLIFVHKYFMRETTFTGKKNYNIKRDYHARIHDLFGIDPQVVEQAQVALQENLKRERESGLWLPRRPAPEPAPTEP